MANNERVNEQLAGAVRELRDSNLRVASASSAMATAAGGIVKGSKAMAKDIIDKSGLASFKSLPFAGLAASLGGKAFQMMKQKKENRLLELQLGLAKGSAKGLRAEQELVKARKQQLEALKDAATKLGLSGDSIIKVADGVAYNAEDQTVAPDGGMSASEVETARESERIVQRSNTLLESIADNTKNMLKSFLGAAAKGGGLGLGVLAGLIAAPVIIIVEFFKSLGAELKALNKFTGGRLAKIFKPFIRFFDAIADITTKGGTGQFLKKDTAKIFGRFTKMITKVVGSVRRVFLRVINFGKRIVSTFSKFSKFAGGFSKTFSSITKFAKMFGSILGKIFLPITILMGLWDLVTGALAGFNESDNKTLVAKFVDGIGGGLAKLISNIVGFPLNLLKSGIVWIGTKFGLDMSGLKNLDFVKIISDMVKYPFNLISDAVDWIGTLFTDPAAALTKLWTALVGEGGLIDIIFGPIDKGIAWVKGLFGWSTEGQEEFSIATFIKGVFTSIKTWLGTLFKFDSTSSIIASIVNVLTFIPNILKDLITGATGWLLGLFGFGDAAKKLANATDWSFGSLITDAFTAVKDWFVGLFAWGTETGTNAQGDFSFLTLITGVFSSVKKWFTDLFTFGDPNADKSFSLATMLFDTVKDIFDWFKGLFDIDIKGLVNSIPGAGKVLSWFGFGDDEEEVPVEAPAADMKKFEQENEGALNAMEQEEISVRMDKFERGKNAYSGRDTQAKYDADMARFDKLVARENELAIANANLQAALEEKNNAGGGSVTQIDNSTTVNGGGQSGGSTRYIPLTDSSNAWQQYSY